MAILLLIGGVETTTNLLGITFAHLREHPEIAREVWANPEKIPALLEEMLRFDGPVQMLFRHTPCDTELARVQIPNGSLVLQLLGSAHHDVPQLDRSDEQLLARNTRHPILSGP